MATASSTYQDVLDAVGRYYGTGSDEWVEFAKYNLHADNLAEMLRQVPGVDVHVNKAGEVIGYSVSGNVAMNDGGVASSLINSNAQTGTAAASNTTTIQTLGNFTADPQTGDVSPTQNIPKKTGGVASTAVATIGKVASVVAAAGIGLKAGRAVNNLIYDNNPTFWADLTDTPEGSEAAEEWARITAAYDEIDKDGKITHFLNVIAGLDGKESTAYVDENALAYYMWQLNNAGYFAEGEIVYPDPPTETSDSYIIHPTATNVANMWVELANRKTVETDRANLLARTAEVVAYYEGADLVAMHGDTGSNSIYTNGLWGVNFNKTYTIAKGSSYGGAYLYYVPFSETDYTTRKRARFYGTAGMNTSQGSSYAVGQQLMYPNDGKDLYISNINTTAESAMEGVEDVPGATLPSTSGWDSPAATLASLKNQYPEWWDDVYENDVIGQNGDPRKVTYVPIPLPANYNNGNPITVDNPTGQSNPTVDPDNPSVTDDLLRTIIAILTKPATDPSTITDPKTDDPTNTETNPPDTGSGVTPPLIVPVGSASALWAVYNPTQAEINSLGAWLWSNNFVDQLLKMFNDPMQAIIGLHKTFIPPATGSAQNIIVGYLDSGVSSLTVPTQYSTVDCGTVDCAEYFGNVFDYSPYTRVYIYLPFIGFKELDVAQVMRSKINVKYRGDAYTGACLAEVTVMRDNESGGVLYSYSGDCAARYPLSHGSYMGIVNAIAGIGIGIGTALAGAPSIGIAGAVGMAQHARATVEHSGSFSGNSGAMGIKKPYLVVMRPQPAMADNYEHFTGQPSNSNVVLGSASGYVRVKECHVEDIATATDAEKQMIESALKTGVII